MTAKEKEIVEQHAKASFDAVCSAIGEFMCEKGRAYNEGMRDGIMIGAKILDNLRKPSEDNRAKIQELLWVFSCDASVDPKETTEELIRLAQCCAPSSCRQENDRKI
jgi:hypothetical protein